MNFNSVCVEGEGNHHRGSTERVPYIFFPKRGGLHIKQHNAYTTHFLQKGHCTYAQRETLRVSIS